jgi:hypothetical protein
MCASKLVARVSTILFAGLFGVSSLAWAQAGTAGLSGTVTDAQGAVVPGATVTATHLATGAIRVGVSNNRGVYSFPALPPGNYTVKVELSGFRTAVHEAVLLRVDSTTQLDSVLETGAVTEQVTVHEATPIINTTDASVGQTMSKETIDRLPVEGQNVVHLLSLQPGTVFIPTQNANSQDPRFGAVSGSRADQQSVTLDGIDVNDPQLQSAFTSAVRMTQEALQEFKVSTTNFGADAGRTSGPQVSLVTRSGTNDYDGAGYWFGRRTATSSNEYFLKLSQLRAGQESKAPKLDKDIFGGSLGGPIRHNKMFFFANYEGFKENSETPVVRAVPSDSFRDGVIMYRCAVASACPGGSVRGFRNTHAVQSGWFGLTPGQIASLDPLGIGPSVAASQYFSQYPSPNDPGQDGVNIMNYRFAAPVQNDFKTLISKVDYRISDGHSLFGRLNLQDDEINAAPQFPGQDPATRTLQENRGFAFGYDAALSSTLVNSFRYGMTRIDSDVVGLQADNAVVFRFIAPFEAQTNNNQRSTPTHNIVNDLSYLRGTHTFKAGTNLRWTRIPSTRDNNSWLNATVNPSWVAGQGTTYMPGGVNCTTPGCPGLPAVASNFTAGYADAWLNSLGVLSQANLAANYDREGNSLPVGQPIFREYASDEYEFYIQDSWRIRPNLTVTAGVRYSLYSPPYEVNGLQVAPTVSMGEWFNRRAEGMRNGVPSNQDPIVSFDLAGPKNGRKGYYDWDTNNFAPRFAVAWTPDADSGFLGWLTGGDWMVVRGGYSKVFDRVGQGLALQFDQFNSFGMSTALSSPFGLANDYITTLWAADQFCSPACSIYGPFAYFNPQYDSLAATSSIGWANYNSMILTLRKRYSSGIQFDINYTLSDSKDTGSQVERGASFSNFGNGGNTGFLLNSFDPGANYGRSDFDVTHQLNANWIVDLPFGQGRHFGGGATGFLNALIGDWSIAGLTRWTSGFPFNVANCRSCWATNWNVQGNAPLVDPGRLPETRTTRNAVDGFPSAFADPQEALTYFRSLLPGEVGIRNELRGDGFFTIDTSLSKGFAMPFGHRLRFRWDVFNLTNTPKFNVGGPVQAGAPLAVTMLPDRTGFGRYNSTLAACDGQAGRCMQFGLRYEF